jgi:hypothetical protein
VGGRDIEQLKKIAREVLGGRNANDSDAGPFAGGVSYAREVANRALFDAINDRGVAHPVAIKFLQSLNGPAKMHPPTLLFMSL